MAVGGGGPRKWSRDMFRYITVRRERERDEMMAAMDASVAGRVALVTGGTGAIGGAVVKQLAAQGCRIIVADLDQETCAAAAAALPTASTGIAIDVADESSVSDGVDTALRELGAEGVDILVNIAGILSNNKVFETTAEEWRRVNAINYDGCFFLAKKCMPHMQKQSGGASST